MPQQEVPQEEGNQMHFKSAKAALKFFAGCFEKFYCISRQLWTDRTGVSGLSNGRGPCFSCNFATSMRQSKATVSDCSLTLVQALCRRPWLALDASNHSDLAVFSEVLLKRCYEVGRMLEKIGLLGLENAGSY